MRPRERYIVLRLEQTSHCFSQAVWCCEPDTQTSRAPAFSSEMDTKMEEMAKDTGIDTSPADEHIVGITTIIYIDPAREAAVRRKFDIYVVPISVIYLVMSTLDRNNVSSC